VGVILSTITKWELRKNKTMQRCISQQTLYINNNYYITTLNVKEKGLG